MSDNRAYQDARKNKEPKMMVNVPIDHTTSRLSKAAKHLRFCTDEEGNIWAMPVVGYRYDSVTGEMVEATPVPAMTWLETAHGVVVTQQWYTVLDETNVHVNGVAVRLGVADETIEIRVTIDGIVFDAVATIPCTFAANNHTGIEDEIRLTNGDPAFIMSAAGAALSVNYTTSPIYWLIGKHVVIEVRKTTAAGAATLTSWVLYRKF